MTLDDFICDGPTGINGMPMLIRAHMAAPVVTHDEVLLLDGPMSHAAFMRSEVALGRNAFPRLSKTTEPLTFRLPLASECVGDAWVWCVSSAHWPEHVARSTHYIRRRPPVEYMQRHTGVARVDISKGGTKSLNAPAPQIFANTITWFAVGDIDGVRDLLEDVSNIGKLSGHGRGEVVRWEVGEHEDWEAWRSRPMPSAGGWDVVPTVPPHWHPMRRVKGDAWR